MNEETRAYIYRVTLAVVPILIALGVVIPGGSELWFALVATVLSYGGNVLATKNTTTKSDEARHSNDG